MGSKIDDSEQNDITLVDTKDVHTKKDYRNSDKKSNVAKNCNLSAGVNNLSKAGIDTESVQLLDNFDNTFEPIHSDKVLLHEIDPKTSDNVKNASEITNEEKTGSDAKDGRLFFNIED